MGTATRKTTTITTCHISVWHGIQAAAVDTTGELGYDGLNGTRKIGPSYAKSVVYI